MNFTRLNRRRAMSLLELIVVLGIMALIAGLLLSAVMKVRESSKRTACVNNLRQLGLAAHMYEGQNGHLMPGWESGALSGQMPYAGWPAYLLPYVEQSSLWQRAVEAFRSDPHPTAFYGHEPHAVLLATVVPLYTCPSDSRLPGPVNVEGTGLAFTSYMGNEGANLFKRDGVLFFDSKTRYLEILDGKSTTLLYLERPPSTDFVLGWWYRGWGQNHDGSAEMNLGVREINVYPRYTDCPRGPYHFTSESGRTNCSTFRPWSFHPGGAHFAFCDGSVKFLTPTIDELLPALATRNGNEPVQQLD